MTTSVRSAGLYMRISRDQTGEGLGVERQEKDCRALAERLGWDVTEVYIDNDISATSGKVRPAYRRLLADLSNGKVDAIIAWHPDRLYRRTTDLEELVKIIQATKAVVATATAGDVDLTSPTGLMIAEILASVAMYEVRHKAERWSRSFVQRREDGMPLRTGSRMFGYTDDGQIIDTEAELIRSMAAGVIAGETILGISNRLDALGIRGTRGGAFTPIAVKKVLSNPRIAGWSTLNGEIVAEGKWEPILDKEQFEQVRAIFSGRTRAYVPRVALLPGLIFCGKCGHRLITGQANRKVRIYRCPNRAGMRGCGGVTGKAEPIEEFVEGFAREALADERVLDSLASLHAQPRDELAEVTALELRILELEAQLEEPDVPVAALLRGIARAKERRDTLLRNVSARGVVAIPKGAADWPTDLPQRRALIELVVERINLLPADPTRGSVHGFDHGRLDVVAREVGPA